MMMSLNQLTTLNELITIATISHTFRQKLLTNPEQALTIGYEGYTLQLTQEDKEILFRANAKSLEELATYTLNQKMTLPPSVNQPTILLVSDYPLMTDTLNTLLKNEFKIRTTNTNHIFENIYGRELILLYSNTPISLKLYTKLIRLLKEQQLVLLTDIKNIPCNCLANTALISLKESQEQIIKTLKEIIQQKTFYSPQAAIQLAEHYTTTRQSSQKLTQREEEVIQYLTLTNKEIARKLNISPGTVRCHILRINRKLGLDLRKKELN